MVVISPMCPPLSQPSAIMPSAPIDSSLLASATDETTGNTLMPLLFQSSMYLPGFPAPVVTRDAPDSAITSAILSTSGFIIIRLMPKGLSVFALTASISAFSISAFIAPVPMIPMAPAFDTSAANEPVATCAIPP